MRSFAHRRIKLEAKLELIVGTVAGWELRRWGLHPHPRGTAVAKKRATAAPLAPCYENAHSVEGNNLLALRACSAYPIFSPAGWAEGPFNTPATKRARDLQKKAATLSSGRESFRKSRLPDPAPRRERNLQKVLTKQGQP